MTPTDVPRHERTIVLRVAGAIVIALAVSDFVAVANGAPIWVLAAGAFGGAVAGIGGGRFILRLLPAVPSSDSMIDVRPDDDRIN
jgi:hypothetical protein